MQNDRLWNNSVNACRPNIIIHTYAYYYNLDQFNINTIYRLRFIIIFSTQIYEKKKEMFLPTLSADVMETKMCLN